jgi:hypothetical protein
MRRSGSERVSLENAMGFGLFSRSIHLVSAGARISGDLCVPDHPLGLMVLVSGQTDHGEIIREAAGYLERRGFATLVLEHDDCVAVVSDIDWAAVHPALGRVPVSCWASSSL